MNLALPSECFGDLDWLIAGETHICLTGISYPINPTQSSRIPDNICGTRGPFPAVAAMVMSVLLVVGRWLSLITSTQILHTIRNTMKLIYSCLNSIRGVRTPRINFILFLSQTRFSPSLFWSKSGLNNLSKFWCYPLFPYYLLFILSYLFPRCTNWVAAKTRLKFRPPKFRFFLDQV